MNRMSEQLKRDKTTTRTSPKSANGNRVFEIYNEAPITTEAATALRVSPVCATGGPRAVEPADSALNMAEYLPSIPMWTVFGTRYVRTPTAISSTGNPDPCMSYCSPHLHWRR